MGLQKNNKQYNYSLRLCTLADPSDTPALTFPRRLLKVPARGGLQSPLQSGQKAVAPQQHRAQAVSTGAQPWAQSPPCGSDLLLLWPGGHIVHATVTRQEFRRPPTCWTQSQVRSGPKGAPIQQGDRQGHLMLSGTMLLNTVHLLLPDRKSVV